MYTRIEGFLIQDSLLYKNHTIGVPYVYKN